jgi:hypothetical protein
VVIGVESLAGPASEDCSLFRGPDFLGACEKAADGDPEHREGEVIGAVTGDRWLGGESTD